MNRLDRYDSLFKYYAERTTIDWRLLKAQAIAESALDPKAVSKAGAQGLAQFMAPTWAEWGAGGAVTNAEDSISAQSRYMDWLIKKLGDMRYALAAYNWGIGRVMGFKTAGIQFDDAVTQMPKETRDYVSRVMKRYWELTKVQI